MSKPVDRDTLALYLLEELDDRATAEVERLVSEDPEWAAALQEEAQFELAMFEVADAAAARRMPVVVPAEPEAPVSWLATLRQWFLPAVPVLALAALLVVGLPSSTPAPLPGYTLELVHGGEAMVRGAELPSSDLPIYTHGSAMELRLVPATAYGGRLSVVVTVDGAPVSVTPEITEKGTVRIYGVFGDDLPAQTPGPHRVEVRLTPQGAEADAVLVFTRDFVWREAAE
jgi:hypothetical protein